MRRQSSWLYPAILFLLTVNLLLGGLVYAEIEHSDLFVREMQVDGGEPAAASPDVARPGAATVPSVPAEAAFSVISERPLFSPERRPAETAEETPAAPAPSAPPPLIVTGIVGAGEDSIAILRDPSPARQRDPGQVVRTGEVVQGWTVEAILPAEQKVILVSSERRVELELVVEEVSPTPPRAQPSVQPSINRAIQGRIRRGVTPRQPPTEQ